MKLTTAHIATSLLLTTTAISSTPEDQNHSSMPDCPMSAEQAKTVDERGDKGMGFSHEKTTHHFRLLPDGGSIEVAAHTASDQESRDQIRVHLRHISKLFADGNFEIPMFVHNSVPPGVEVMQKRKDKIAYRYEETDKGGRVRITTVDPEALKAVHDFLRFQITEHCTGDTVEVSSPAT